jgi:hypothetical protein
VPVPRFPTMSRRESTRVNGSPQLRIVGLPPNRVMGHPIHRGEQGIERLGPKVLITSYQTNNSHRVRSKFTQNVTGARFINLLRVSATTHDYQGLSGSEASELRTKVPSDPNGGSSILNL